jgi:hypothetical protein
VLAMIERKKQSFQNRSISQNRLSGLFKGVLGEYSAVFRVMKEKKGKYNCLGSVNQAFLCFFFFKKIRMSENTAFRLFWL